VVRGVCVLAIAAVAAAAAGSPATATGRPLNQHARRLAAATPVVRLKPRNRARPRIVGRPQVGVRLKATRGDWTAKPDAYTYRWLRCSLGGRGCARIAGALGRRYTPRSGDVGVTLRVQVTARDASGSGRATSRPTRVVREGRNARLVALWHMDETSGTTMVDSVGGNNGTLYHVALGVPGFAGTAFGFNGQYSYVSVPSADVLNPGATNITLTLHLNTTNIPDPPPGDFDLLRKGTYPTGSEYKVELQHSGRASCGFKGSVGSSELIAGPPLYDGRWHEVQCIKAPTAIQLVVDGKVFTQPAEVGSITNTAPVVIGTHPGGDWYAGDLDEVSIQIG
jgi:hypothetical protein